MDNRGEVLQRQDASALFRDRALQTMDLKLRNELHLTRKFWHVSGIVVIAFLIDTLAQRDSLFYLSVAAILIIPFDILRLKRRDLNHRIVTLFKPIIRLDEVGKISGTS